MNDDLTKLKNKSQILVKAYCFLNFCSVGDVAMNLGGRVASNLRRFIFAEVLPAGFMKTDTEERGCG